MNICFIEKNNMHYAFFPTECVCMCLCVLGQYSYTKVDLKSGTVLKPLSVLQLMYVQTKAKFQKGGVFNKQI